MMKPDTKDGKNTARVKAGKKNVQARADYLVHQRIENNMIRPMPVAHEVKISRYRDALLSELVGKVSQAIFETLDGRSMELLDKVPDNTEIARYSDFRQYVSYCNKIDIAPLPFTDHSVDAYLSYMMANGRKRSTIDRHLSSLVAWADLLELPDPRRSFKVKARLSQIRKRVKSKPRQATGLRVVHLEHALARLNPKIPRDVQDIALLFVGFETLCRQSELISFDWEDLYLEPDGSAVLELDGSKTDQDGEGAVLYLSRNTTDLLLGWKKMTGQDSGPIFRGIYSNGRMGDRLSAGGVARSYRRTARRMGLAPAAFSGHSARVGAAQEMVERNIDAAKIMLSGRWKTLKMVTQYAQRINAKRGGIADLARQVGWDKPRAAPPAHGAIENHTEPTQDENTGNTAPTFARNSEA